MITKVNVRVLAADQNGNPLSGAEVTIRLNQADTDASGGYVVPEAITVIADADGVALASLWPNALGTSGSQYYVEILNPDTGDTFVVEATIPNHDCDLHTVASLPPSPDAVVATPVTVLSNGAGAAAMKRVQVRVLFNDQQGNPVSNGNVIAILNRVEVDPDVGFIMPEEISAMTDVDGKCTLLMWPNALGSTASRYVFTLTNPDTGDDLSVIAAIPDADCDLHLVADLPAYPGKTDGQLIVEQVIAVASQVFTSTQQIAVDRSVVEQIGVAAATAAQSASDNALLSQQAIGDAQAARDAALTAQQGAETAAEGITTAAAAAEQSHQDALMQAGLAADSALAAHASEDSVIAAKTAAETARDTANSAATTATTQAGIATAKAQEASGSAAAALVSQTAASTSETNAGNAATTAITKASEASDSAATANVSRIAAGISETNAATSADAANMAKVNAQTAQGLAEAARDAAQVAEFNASTYAGQALNSASTATTAVDAATTKAEEATTSASAAAQSASNALSSANTAVEANNDAYNWSITAWEWAVKMDGPVSSGDYSAKYYAQQAAASASQAAASRIQADWAIVDPASDAFIQHKPVLAPIATSGNKADIGLGNVDNTADAIKAVLSSTKLATARTINGVLFDGTASITINAVDATAREPAIVAGTVGQFWKGNKTWAVLASADVTGALGFTPYNAANPAGYITSAASITGTAAGLSATLGVGSGGTGATTAANARINLGLAAVASSGAYADLIGKPTLAAVATSGAKADVGLGNVDNTSDVNKPVSTAQQTALNQKVNKASDTLTKPTITGYIEAFQALNSGAAVTLNPDLGTLIELTITASTTITLPAAVAGVGFTLIAKYSGAFALAFAGGTAIKWAGGTAPAATSVNAKMDKYIFTCGSGYTLAQDGGRNF